jgi:hypothetical protein
LGVVEVVEDDEAELDLYFWEVVEEDLFVDVGVKDFVDYASWEVLDNWFVFIVHEVLNKGVDNA